MAEESSERLRSSVDRGGAYGRAPGDLLLRDVEVEGHRTDVLLRHGRIATIGSRLAAPGAAVWRAAGGALIPGLHDHHVHLLALAAARNSISVAGPDINNLAEMTAAMRSCSHKLESDAWIRVVGYDESIAGPLNRYALDSMVAGQPVRVQHSSGALWVLNSLALKIAGISSGDRPGIELDVDGLPTGRLYGLDGWLRDRVPAPKLDLQATAAEFAALGVTGVTDATPFDRPADVDALAELARAGSPVRIVVTGSPWLARVETDDLCYGPAKVVIADHSLPTIDQVLEGFRVAHVAGRSVAVHSVSLESLILALAAWDEAGAAPGDRLEHGAIVPPEQARRLADLGVTVVTQPNFVYERGDLYLAGVDPRDIPYLYPCRTLLDAGVAVAFGTDAPFGSPDPWAAIVAATNRLTSSGKPLGCTERVDAQTALNCFLGDWRMPGGPPRRVAQGAPADLCVLKGPLSEALAAPAKEAVAATIVGGRVVSLASLTLIAAAP